MTDKQFTAENGYFDLPDAPGLGIEMNVEEAKKYPYKKPKPLRINMLGA